MSIRRGVVGCVGGTSRQLAGVGRGGRTRIELAVLGRCRAQAGVEQARLVGRPPEGGGGGGETSEERPEVGEEERTVGEASEAGPEEEGEGGEKGVKRGGLRG
jgi:hypothetical protein